MFVICNTKSGKYCTDLDAHTRKQQQVSARAKYYNKEILSPTVWVYVLIKFLHSRIDLVQISHNYVQLR